MRACVIDCEDGIAQALIDAGMQVSLGTLGKRYKCPQTHMPLPYYVGHVPRFLQDFDLVVVDFGGLPEHVVMFEPPPKGYHEGYWGSNTGLLDTRPLGARALTSEVAELMDAGGLLIVHAAKPQDITVEKDNDYLNSKGKLHRPVWASIWDIMPTKLRQTFELRDMSGKVVTARPSSSVGKVLERLSSKLSYRAGFDLSVDSKCSTEIVAENARGEVVGFTINRREDPGVFALILPQCSDWHSLYKEICASCLPDLCPSKYTGIGSQGWAQNPTYENDQVAALRSEIDRVAAESRRAIDEITGQIAAAKEDAPWEENLLTQTDDVLVTAVRMALEEIGFEGVVELDHEKGVKGQKELDEDIQVTGPAAMLLIEVKGIGGMPADAEVLQVTKHVIKRAKEFKRFDVRPISIFNHQRFVEPQNRQVGLVRQGIKDAVVSAELSVVSTWTLFQLVRGMRRWNWPKECVRKSLLEVGEVAPIPSNYYSIGLVDEVWREASAVGIPSIVRNVPAGSTIACAHLGRFYEATVDSLQVHGAVRPEAVIGDDLGFPIPAGWDFVRKGLQVHLRIDDESAA